jgi:hypothetical protein
MPIHYIARNVCGFHVYYIARNVCKCYVYNVRNVHRFHVYIVKNVRRFHVYIVDSMAILSDLYVDLMSIFDVTLKYMHSRAIPFLLSLKGGTGMWWSVISGICLQVLRYLYVSRGGLSENELLELVPGLTWSFLAPFCYLMHEHLVLKYQGGLLMFAHEQVKGKIFGPVWKYIYLIMIHVFV